VGKGDIQHLAVVLPHDKVVVSSAWLRLAVVVLDGVEALLGRHDPNRTECFDLADVAEHVDDSPERSLVGAEHLHSFAQLRVRLLHVRLVRVVAHGRSLPGVKIVCSAAAIASFG